MSDKHNFIWALQYLYYCEANSPWTDREYDAYCKHHKVSGIGGSDVARHYPPEIQKLAYEIKTHPLWFKWRKVDPVDFVATSDGWLPVNVAPDRKMP